MFAKLIKYYKTINFCIPTVLKIFYLFSYYWELFINETTVYLYKRLLTFINLNYFKVITLNNFINTYQVQNYPTNFLVNIKLTPQNFSGNIRGLKNFMKPVLNEKVILHHTNLSAFEFVDYSKSEFTIHFIRVQRRYNKRRYSRVKAFSRPSFFGGIALSSIFLSCFWGGTMKGVD
jgi:hypothetical protein